MILTTWHFRFRRSMAVTPNSINDRKIRREEERHRADCESCYSEPPDPVSNVTNAQAASLYFVDGERTIDFVLVWKDEKDGDAIIEDLKCTKRAIFEENLVYEGLELERETFQSLHFTKVHAPIEVLRRYSEILKLRLPMKEVSCPNSFNSLISFSLQFLINFQMFFQIFGNKQTKKNLFSSRCAKYKSKIA